MSKNNKIRLIISGGGTGGHIFPALSIANEVKDRYPDADILFVGAEGRMEMERVPAAGYKIVGLPVRGLKRKLTFENIRVILDFLKSRKMARKLIREFDPDAAVGVGGYASAPVLNAAAKMKIPCLLQEQNSYAGITNKILAKKVEKICVAYDNMERFFPKDKIIKTGNPVRKIEINNTLKKEAIEHFGLKPDVSVLFLMGGSLGARTMNESMLQNLDLVLKSGVQVLWQTGKYYYEGIQKQLEGINIENLHVMDFVGRMDLAYNVADLVVSRAGALSLSELCLVGKPSILVPSPNVAEDHQTQNALALVKEDAALMVKDVEASESLIPLALETLKNKDKIKELSTNALRLAKPKATASIVDELIKIMNK